MRGVRETVQSTHALWLHGSILMRRRSFLHYQSERRRMEFVADLSERAPGERGTPVHHSAGPAATCPLYGVSRSARKPARSYLKLRLLILRYRAHKKLPPNQARSWCMLVVVLWWKPVTFCDADFVSAPGALINACIRSFTAWLAHCIKICVITLLQKIAIFVERHHFPF
jgi:hypothetical protein